MGNLYKDLINSKKTLTDLLLDEITDYDIYCELTGSDIEIGRAFHSPLRDDDTRASFSLYSPESEYVDIREDELWWRDFTTKNFGNVFQFAKRYAEFHYELHLETRRDVIQFLDEELSLGIFGTEKVNREKRVVDWEEAKKKRDIYFTSREYTRRDIFWWAMYAVDEELLKQHNVKSVKYLLNDDNTIRYESRAMELIYAYVVYDKIKLYRPEGGEFKWRNTCPSHYMQGAQQCTRNDILIITKSMKDLLCFKSLMHTDAIALQGEGMTIPSDMINKIKARYKRVYVVMDHDPTGIESAERLEKEGFIVRWVSTDLKMIDGKMQVADKDISDYIYNHGVRAAMERLKGMFPEVPNAFRNSRVAYFEQLKKQLTSAA